MRSPYPLTRAAAYRTLAVLRTDLHTAYTTVHRGLRAQRLHALHRKLYIALDNADHWLVRLLLPADVLVDYNKHLTEIGRLAHRLRTTGSLT